MIKIIFYTRIISHSNLKSSSEKITGKVKIKLYKGKATVLAVESPYSLFDEKMATFMKDSIFNQNASAGFIELWNLPQKTAYNLKHNG